MNAEDWKNRLAAIGRAVLNGDPGLLDVLAAEIAEKDRQLEQIASPTPLPNGLRILAVPPESPLPSEPEIQASPEVTEESKGEEQTP